MLILACEQRAVHVLAQALDVRRAAHPELFADFDCFDFYLSRSVIDVRISLKSHPMVFVIEDKRLWRADTMLAYIITFTH